MKLQKLLFPSVACALLAVVQVHAQATLYGIGDLTGGKFYSEVRDATKVGGVIYAVGGSTATSATNNDDRAVLWTSTGGLTAIPDFVTNTVGTGGVVASAITPDGAFIAARLHANATLTTTRAAYVTTSGLTTTNLGNLGNAGNGGTNWSNNATGISDNGSVLYGSAQYSSNGALTQLVRYTSSANSITTVPFVNLASTAASTNMFLASQASVSANGDKVTGIANNSGNFRTTGTTAFLYINSLNDLSIVPYLSGGTWNAGLAINSGGTLGLIAGNSTTFANGALYLYNDTTNTLLGSPDATYTVVGGGSLSDDGAVVTAAFSTAGGAASYIHNPNGWFLLDTVASAAGANLTGWSALNVFGMSSDATLVWGNGLHNGNTEGFVLEFGSGALAAIPEPSAYAALAGLGALALGAWHRRRRLARTA